MCVNLMSFVFECLCPQKYNIEDINELRSQAFSLHSPLKCVDEDLLST